MSDEGDGDKDLVELEKKALHDIDKKGVENGTAGNRLGMLEGGQSRLKRVGQEVEDNGVERVVQQPQLSQGVAVFWERFLHVRSVRVLLVENDDSTRHVVAALLRNCSYEVVEASNGLQAWKILEDISNRIDLVLTEVVMPCISGIALLCKIMSHKSRKNVPVIMMSSHDSMGLVFKCLSKGAVDFLVKPIRKNELKNLWQHLWRRCHSSSGSGSESGTQESVKSKSAEKSDYNSGSNDNHDNGSPAMKFGNGSDHGSGTQSSWTKQAVEDQADSPQLLSYLNEVPECPESTCAQVINHYAKPKECREQKEQPENTELDKALDTAMLKIPDLQPKFSVQMPTLLTSVNQHSAPKLDSGQYSDQIDNRTRELHDMKESTVSAIAIKLSKEPDIIDKGTDENKELSSAEQGLKRLRGAQDVGKTVQDERNVLRRSKSSAFSRYNASSHNKVSVIDVQSPTSQKDDLEENGELRLNIQSHSGSNALNPNGAGIYVDIFSTSNNRLTEAVASKNKAAEHSTNNYLSPSAFQDTKHQVCSSQKMRIEDADAVAAVKMDVPSVCSTEENQVQPAHHQQLTSNYENLLIEKMAEPIPHCGSSTVLGGHLEGNAGNYSVNGSASGSNYGSNGPNGSSSGANAGIVKTESNIRAVGNSGSGDASKNGIGNGSGNDSASGRGDKVDHSKHAQREAALTKFRQKRKERCFKRRVRYQSRKRLAEQRPRIRGQFVRHVPAENSSKDSDS